MPSTAKRKQVVVVGGGTGTFTVLSGLREHPVDLTAIVTMADDGGSTGRLRDELGVLPPGDIRQCLVALSEGSDELRRLFNHRFEQGMLSGHSFGNIFISALEQTTGNLDRALEVARDILKINGAVVPVTLDKIKLVAELKNGKILHGEHHITDYQLVSRFGIKRIYVEPKAKANPKAIRAISEADLIVIGPGNLYCSLLPNLLIEGIPQALRNASGKKVYVANLMNKHGHTDSFTVFDYVDELERRLRKDFFDVVIFNNRKPSAALLKKYADEGEPVVFEKRNRRAKTVGVNLLADELYRSQASDPIRRTLIRHDSKKLAQAIMTIV